jgi:toxin ParE1/3/4
MQIEFLPEAALDLKEIKGDSPEASARVSKIIRERIYQLKNFPKMGPVVRGSKTRRRLIIPRLPYFAVYRIEESSIKILRVYHMKRNWS